MEAGLGLPRPQSLLTGAEGDDSPHPLPKTTLNRSLTHMQVCHTPPNAATDSSRPSSGKAKAALTRPVDGGAMPAPSRVCSGPRAPPPSSLSCRAMRLMVPSGHQDLSGHKNYGKRGQGEGEDDPGMVYDKAHQPSHDAMLWFWLAPPQHIFPLFYPLPTPLGPHLHNPPKSKE